MGLNYSFQIRSARATEFHPVELFVANSLRPTLEQGLSKVSPESLHPWRHNSFLEALQNTGTVVTRHLVTVLLEQESLVD